MKSKKNYIKALIAFPTLALAVSLPTSNSIASISGVDNELNKVDSDVDAVSDEGKDAKAPAAGENGQQQTNNKPSLDLDTTTFNGQYSSKNFYVQNDMPSISNANGPILLGDNGRSIAAYDWYGNPAWFLNLNSEEIGKKAVAESSPSETPTKKEYDAQASYYKYSNALSTQIPWKEVGKKIVDVAYLANRDFLYVLTDTNYLFLIQSTTGTINSVKKLTETIDKITFIDFNNSLYGWNSKQQNGPVYDIDTQRLTLKEAMSSTASGIKEKYIFDILPVSTGYNIALVSNSKFTDKERNGDNITLTALLIQDNGNIFNGSDGRPITRKDKSVDGKDQVTITLDTSIKKYKDIYSATLKKSDDSSILIVGNKVYNINLNKSAMENTTITEISFPTQSGKDKDSSSSSLKAINSAFIDEANLIYFKDESKNIYQISLDNKITSYITIQTQGGSAVFSDNNVNSSRIYPVNKNGNEQIALKGIGYIATPTGFVATGFKNGGLLNYNFTNGAKKPSFSLPPTYNKSAPSSFDYTSIKYSNASSADQYKTEFYSDDISGELYVKTRLNIPSWYDTRVNTFTSSYVIGKWNCAKIEDVTTWVNQNAFNRIAGGLFAKRSPDQISDDDVTKYADQILSLPPVVTSSDEKEVKMIVTNRVGKENDGFGKITLQATVKYKNKKGNIVSYFMKNHDYKVKKEADAYNFKFYGGDENDTSTNKTVDISSLGSSFTNFKNTLPSLVNPSSDNLQAFIETEDKYPTDTRRVITVTNKNDNEGTMTVKVHYNGLKVDTPATFYITYTGMATKISNHINFKGDEISEDKIPIYDGSPVFGDDKINDITTITEYKNYNEKLATDIQANQLNLAYNSNLSLMGFNPEVSIEQDKETGTISSHDAEYGSITLVLDYRNSKSELLGISLPDDYWNDFGLEKGVIKQRYIGFLPIGATYGVELKSYNSPEVQNVVQNNNVNADIAPTQLISTLDIRGYNTEGQTPNITVQNFSWNGENLTFAVHAQSTKYNTVTTDKTFTISWSPKFAAIRQRNLIISSTTSILGVALVSAAVTFYILRRNKIRRFMK